MPVRPVAILAYSHDPSRVLPEIGKEMASVETLFDSTNLTVKADPQTTPQKLQELWMKYQGEVLIFHFGGHAGPSVLQLNQAKDTARIVFAEGVSNFIGKFCPNIKLVFLNGCSTEDQAQYFIQNGVSAVIATEMPVRDDVASHFAERFYTFFLKNKLSLKVAFDAALIGVKEKFGTSKVTDNRGKIITELLQEATRSSILIGKKIRKNAEVYVLKPHPEKPAVEQETFEDWGAGFARSGNIRKTEDSQQRKTGGVDEESYLLCDRVQQYPEFEKILQKKLSGAAPDPFFFFVHAEEEHCPDDLPERFNRYGLPAFCRQKSFSEEIVLSEPDVFRGGNPDDPANPTRDLYKIRLSEIYKEHFEGELAQANHLYKLFRRPGDEEVLVVLHKFLPDEWSDYYDPALNEALQAKIETLLRYYIGDFSAYLRDGFSERLIVIFSVQYYEPNDFFPGLFQRLEQDFTAERVKALGNLPPVRKGDVGRWQDETLKEQFFLVNDIFLDRKGNPAAVLPFFDAKKILIRHIEQFNREKAANVKS